PREMLTQRAGRPRACRCPLCALSRCWTFLVQRLGYAGERNAGTRRFAHGRLARWLWLVPGAVGLAITASIMLVLPPDRTLHGFGDFILKVSPLFLAVLTIAFFPRGGGASLGLVLLGFLFYLGYVDSAFVIQVTHLVDAALAERAGEQFNAFYRFAIFVNAYTVLSAVLAYRLGGASAARVLKLGGAGILLLISGLNDLTMWAMYPWPDGQRPAVFSWASHVSIFFGHAPGLPEMLLFLAAHLLLIAFLLALPVQRWLDHATARKGI
ncbi:MAG: hypothetical protein ACRDI2_13690, partial [Chloroflexota bacterium]